MNYHKVQIKAADFGRFAAEAAACGENPLSGRASAAFQPHFQR